MSLQQDQDLWYHVGRSDGVPKTATEPAFSSGNNFAGEPFAQVHPAFCNHRPCCAQKVPVATGFRSASFSLPSSQVAAIGKGYFTGACHCAGGVSSTELQSHHNSVLKAWQVRCQCYLDPCAFFRPGFPRCTLPLGCRPSRPSHTLPTRWTIATGSRTT